MFAGEFRCLADRTGLYVLPPAFRLAFPPDGDDADRSIVFLKSLEGSLWLYRAQSIPSEVDRKGRLAIPKELREDADIGSDFVLIGLYDRLELWSPGRWDAYLLRLGDQQELLLEKIVSLL
jgi:DNA-binding transcriptional regulator/RsmH inhibitor MraZ